MLMKSKQKYESNHESLLKILILQYVVHKKSYDIIA